MLDQPGLEHGPEVVSALPREVAVAILPLMSNDQVADGSLLPFLLKRAGFDPAAVSAPFVAILVDVTGLVIYFSVAALVLRGTI